MTKPVSPHEIPKTYDPHTTEAHIYDLWMNGGCFTPTIGKQAKPFVIVMPPPNVTGELHMGHALTAALQDLMIRWNRMKGKSTLYLPGTDHAGIATQVVVERMLAKNNQSRHDLGRERFMETVWTWVTKYGDRIYEQTKRLGASCDWSRAAFTLDEGPSRAVRTTFVNLYKKGLIYRGERIGNWCPRCSTTLSDLEVKYQEEDSNLYSIRYLLEGSDKFVTIATTRPETMLADTAVAINPEDERHNHLIGSNVLIPITDRLIPIVGDNEVDIEFGTGILKVTPGHDPVDFEIGRRHKLPVVNLLNLDGTMNENAGHYQGLDRLDVREKIVDELTQTSSLEKIEPYHHSVGHCDRCGDIVEPFVSTQWYMKMKPLAEPAINAVKDESIQIIPKRFSKVYFNWMDNIRDWVISRQLWWGHRIPVWYCQECNEIIVEYENPTKCDACESENLDQDPDVLDTWFSSALWPHSTMGWPDDTEDMNAFYPTTVLETGYDILFFWVARMIMMGLENTGKIPFKTIYLHGLVLDPEGIKMSKTKGNVLDPLELIDMYGADALRFALTTGTSPGNNMRLNESKLESSRNFANKLWNASRYVMSNLDPTDGSYSSAWPPEPKHREDRWIMSLLSRATVEVEDRMTGFQFGEAQKIIHDFLWNEYCDWYVEMTKSRIGNGDKSALPILIYVLENVLRLLHPFMPFITEEIWQSFIKYLPTRANHPSMLMSAEYPSANSDHLDDEAEKEISTVTEMIRAVRNLRAEFRIQPNVSIEAIVDAPAIKSVIEAESPVIKALSQVSKIRFENVDVNVSTQVTVVLTKGTITVPLSGVVDVGKEKMRLTKELREISNILVSLSHRLQDEKFLSRAPQDVVEKEQNRKYSMEDRRARLEEILSRLG